MQNAINNLKENNLKRVAEIVVKYQKKLQPVTVEVENYE